MTTISIIFVDDVLAFLNGHVKDYFINMIYDGANFMLRGTGQVY